jgi:hypothetical protein
MGSDLRLLVNLCEKCNDNGERYFEGDLAGLQVLMRKLPDGSWAVMMEYPKLTGREWIAYKWLLEGNLQ